MSSTTIQHFNGENLTGEKRSIALPIDSLAHFMEMSLKDGAEKSAGMRKLLEARDCFLRAGIEE